MLSDSSGARPWQSLGCSSSVAVCTASASTFDVYIPAAAILASNAYAESGVFVLNMTTSATAWPPGSDIVITLYTVSTHASEVSVPNILLEAPVRVLAGTAASFAPLPPRAEAFIPDCSDVICASAEYKCYPVGGNPAAAVPCDEFDFPACPSNGCGPQEPVRRTVACYEGFRRLMAIAACYHVPVMPLSVRECPAVFNDCVGFVSSQSECLDSINTSHACSAGPRDVSFRRGECRNAAGVAVDPSWCSYEKINVMCTLPPCGQRWEARWFAGEPSPCYSGADATCASYRTVDVACRYTVLSDSPGTYPTASSVWLDTAPSVCDQRSAPARIVRCSPSTPLSLALGAAPVHVFSRCLNGGVCRMSDAFIAGERYAGATGKCQCPLGFSGAFCGHAAWVRNVTTSVFPFGTKKYTVSWKWNPEIPANTLVSVILHRVGGNANATAAEAALLVTPGLPVACVKISTGSFAIDPLKNFDVLPGSWIATVRVSQALQSSSVSFVITPRCEGRCINGGACDGQTALCVCPTGYSGERCEKAPCDTSNCQTITNGAVCANMPDGSFNCSCALSPLTGLPMLQGPACRSPYDLSLCRANMVCLHGGVPEGTVNTLGGVSCSRCTCRNMWRTATCATCLLKCYGGLHDGDCVYCNCATATGFHGADCRCRFVTLALNFPAAAVPWLSLPASAPVSALAREEAKYRWGKLLSHEVIAFMRGAVAPAVATDDFALVAVIASHRSFNTTAGVDMVQVTLRVGADCLAGNNGLLSSEAPAPPEATVPEPTPAEASPSAAVGAAAWVAATVSSPEVADTPPAPAAAVIGGGGGFGGGGVVTPIEIARVYVTIERLRTALTDGSAAGTEILKNYDSASGLFVNDALCVPGQGVTKCPSGTGTAQMDEWTAPVRGPLVTGSNYIRN